MSSGQTTPDPIEPSGERQTIRNRFAVVGKRTVALLTVGVFTVVLTGLQTFLMWRQVEVSDRQAEIMERQTAVAERQAAIAETQTRIMDQQTAMSRVSMSPKFTFLSDGNDFVINNTGEGVRDMKGRCVVYLSAKEGSNGKGNIEVIGFHTEQSGFTLKSKQLVFWTTSWSGNQDDAKLHEYYSTVPFFDDFRLMYFAEVEYTNIVGERRQERYTMTGPGIEVKPVEAQPVMNAKVDIKPFMNRPEPDVSGARALIASTIAGVKAGGKQ